MEIKKKSNIVEVTSCFGFFTSMIFFMVAIPLFLLIAGVILLLVGLVPMIGRLQKKQEIRIWQAIFIGIGGTMIAFVALVTIFFPEWGLFVVLWVLMGGA